MSTLKHQGYISTWYDRQIFAGQEVQEEINAHLSTAHIILLLVSPDFMASNYCISKEVEEAVKRHKAGRAYVIPVILRPVDWENVSFSDLQPLPLNSKPIALWPNRDEAFLDVVNGIKKVIQKINTEYTQKHFYEELPLQEKSIFFYIKNIHTASDFFTSHQSKIAEIYDFYKETLDRIAQAISHQHSIAFTYLSTRKEKDASYRRLDPHYITYTDGHLYLIGFSNEFNHFLEFRVDQIVPSSLVIEPYIIIPRRQRQSIGFRYWVYESAVSDTADHWLTAIVEGEELVSDTVGHVQKRFLINATAYSASHIIKQLLPYGGNVELIAPPSLREQMIQTIQKISYLYHS